MLTIARRIGRRAYRVINWLGHDGEPVLILALFAIGAAYSIWSR